MQIPFRSTHAKHGARRVSRRALLNVPGAWLLASTLACSQTLDGPNVAESAAALAADSNANQFYSSPDIDLCWATDPDTHEAPPGAWIAERKSQMQALINGWASGTGLNFRWATNCRSPVYENGVFSYAQDEVRIMFDVPPFSGVHDPIAGPNCTAEYGNTSYYGSRGDNKCAFNVYFDSNADDWAVLHEVGHGLGLPHEHARRDTPRDCRNYQPTENDDGSTVGDDTTVTMIPDNDAVTGDRHFMTFDKSGVVTRLYTHILVEHPRPSDLIISIHAPSGQSAVIHNRSSSLPQRSWDSADEPSLSPLIGATIRGTWELRIRDVVAGSTGTFANWRQTVNGGPEQADFVYLTYVDTDSVMLYGGSPGCPGQGSPHLSNGDHLGFQIMYPPANAPPVIGEGIYRDDVPIILESEWTKRGAAIGDELNEGVLKQFVWSIQNYSGSIVYASSSGTVVTSAPLAAGDYVYGFRARDFWNRDRTRVGVLRVLTKAEHTAVTVAIGL